MPPSPLPGIEEPHVGRIVAIMVLLMAVPFVLLVLRVPSSIALPIIAALAVIGTLYGSYETMRTIHIDRAAARRQ
jgi:TctA family transporter